MGGDAFNPYPEQLLPHRLVEKEQSRVLQQLQRHRQALALPPAGAAAGRAPPAGDARGQRAGQAQRVRHAAHAASRAAGRARAAQAGGEQQGLESPGGRWVEKKRQRVSFFENRVGRRRRETHLADGERLEK